MKLGIIIPFRDRQNHLDCLIPQLKICLHDIDHEIVVIEQSVGKLFNVGMIRNIGTVFLKDCNYYCFHDVDMIPDPIYNDYSFNENITHLASRCSQFKYKMPYKNYVGGVLLAEKKYFDLMNGYSNNYWGWGSEDDDLYLRCQKNNVFVDRRDCIYHCFNHKRDGSNLKKNSDILKLNKTTENFFKNDGINNLKFDIESILEKKEYKLIKVMI